LFFTDEAIPLDADRERLVIGKGDTNGFPDCPHLLLIFEPWTTGFLSMLPRFRKIPANLWFNPMDLADVLVLLGKFPQPRAAVDIFPSPRANPDVVKVMRLAGFVLANRDETDPLQNVFTTFCSPELDVLISRLVGVREVQTCHIVYMGIPLEALTLPSEANPRFP
jgi:hypothetical protein